MSDGQLDASDSTMCKLDYGDTAYMMFAATVVMIQTPAMGMAQAGMIRRKNSLSMLMQVLFGMAIGSLLWAFIGFTLSFGPSHHGWIGDPFHFMFFRNVPVAECLPQFADSIPGSLFASFQMMFALMTPLIVTGSWTEKMTFDAFLIFIVLWPIFVYYPTVHWFWNPDGWLKELGILDFAGGLVIHANTGVAGFAVSYILQRRNLHKLALSHHNLPLSFIGAALVWSGWYSFNGGSALKANFQAAGALLNTHLSASTGALVWSLLSHRKTGNWSLLECMSGAFAGLGGVTAGSGFVEPYAAVIIGSTTATSAFYSVRFFKDYLLLDDVLDVTSLQGTAGVVGSLLVGVFATSEMQPDGGPDGLLYGGGFKLLSIQLLGTVVVLAWSGTWTFFILSVMKRAVGIDVSRETEEQGLDLVQVGEQAYDQRLDLFHDIGPEALTGLLNEACKVGDVEDIKVLITRHGADPDGGDFDGRRPAHIAALNGRLGVLDYLYTHHHVDINCVDSFGGTPILDAFRRKERAVVQWLRKRGAKIESEKVRADLLDTCARGNEEKLQMFIDAGVDLNLCDYDMRTGLMLAASNGHAAVVKKLLDAGVDAEAQDRWKKTAYDAAEESHHTVCAEIIENHLGGEAEINDNAEDQPLADTFPTPETPLLRRRFKFNSRSSVAMTTDLNKKHASVQTFCSAASDGNLKEIIRLVEKGSDPGSSNYDGRTAIMLAAACGHLDVIKYLCSQPNVNVNAMDRWRQTALSEAIRNCHHEIAVYLRQHGAISINKNLGYQLCDAAACGDISRLMRFKNDGSDLNTGDYDGRTALHLAASTPGRLNMVKLLIDNGAFVSPKDRFGQTPLDDAIREGNTDVQEFLQSLESMSEDTTEYCSE